jgi:hypothetical protein
MRAGSPFLATASSGFARPLGPVKLALTAAALLGGLLLPGAARAAESAAPATVAQPSDGYRISVLTMGPGDAFVTLFGHDALLVERSGLPPLVYNFGMYNEEAIAPRHVFGGTLRYFLEVTHFRATLAAYAAANREVVRQNLVLDQSAAQKLALALSVNSEPKNASYAYDFTRDNCTTRVRDALDRALDGSLRRSFTGLSRLTYREQALRFTAGDWPLYFAFDLLLGRNADRPVSAWDETFLPDRLMARLRSVKVPGPAGERSLVASEDVLIRARRAPPRAEPPLRAPYHLLAGVSLGALLAVLGGARARVATLAYGILCAALGLLIGFLGLAVAVLLVTHVHPATHGNLNILVCSPLAFGFVVPALRVAARREGAARSVARWTNIAAIVSCVGAEAAMLVGQESWRVAFLVVPALIGAWFGARRALRTA